MNCKNWIARSGSGSRARSRLRCRRQTLRRLWKIALRRRRRRMPMQARFTTTPNTASTMMEYARTVTITEPAPASPPILTAAGCYSAGVPNMERAPTATSDALLSPTHHFPCWVNMEEAFQSSCEFGQQLVEGFVERLLCALPVSGLLARYCSCLAAQVIYACLL